MVLPVHETSKINGLLDPITQNTSMWQNQEDSDIVYF